MESVMEMTELEPLRTVGLKLISASWGGTGLDPVHICTRRWWRARELAMGGGTRRLQEAAHCAVHGHLSAGIPAGPGVAQTQDGDGRALDIVWRSRRWRKRFYVSPRGGRSAAR